MGNKRLLRAATFALIAAPLAAQAKSVTIEQLLRRLEEPEQKIKLLERKPEIHDFRFMPDFGQDRSMIQDAYVTAICGAGASPTRSSKSRCAQAVLPNRMIGAAFPSTSQRHRMPYQEQ